MKTFRLILVTFLCIIISRQLYCQQSRTIIYSNIDNNTNSKIISIIIEKYEKDSLINLKRPPIYIYDTLNLSDLDSSTVMKEINTRFKKYKLITYSTFSENRKPYYEYTNEFNDYVSPHLFTIKETFFNERGEKEKIRYSVPSSKTNNKADEKLQYISKELSFKSNKLIQENTLNKKNIIEKRIYYDNGIIKEISHFENDKKVGIYEIYSLDGELSVFHIYSKSGKLSFSFERALGFYKVNETRYNDMGEKDE